jgi:hypothetical protein
MASNLPAVVGGELATPAELQRLVATLQGFPTTEEQDRQQLQVCLATCCALSSVAIGVRHSAAVVMLHIRPIAFQRLYRCALMMHDCETVSAACCCRNLGATCAGGSSCCCGFASSARWLPVDHLHLSVITAYHNQTTHTQAAVLHNSLLQQSLTVNHHVLLHPYRRR